MTDAGCDGGRPSHPRQRTLTGRLPDRRSRETARSAQDRRWRLADRPLVVFGSGVEYDWNLLRQREQNLVERLAAATEVVYVERHGSSSKGPCHVMHEAIRRLRPRSSPAAWIPKSAPSFEFVRTPVLPIQGMVPVDRINAWLLARRLRQVVSRPLEECCALVCNPSPYVTCDVAACPLRGSRQRCGATLRRVAGSVRQIRRVHRSRSGRSGGCADVRFLRTLIADRAEHGLTCWQMPQGVDVAYRTRPRPGGSSRAARTERSGRCVVGFLGAISGVIDWGAIIAAATALEDVLFVMCGPKFAPVPAGLPRNIEFRGWVAPEEAPKVIASFSVGLIPYVRNRRTDAVLPTKLIEYLAAGIRVVSSDLPDVVSLSQELGSDLVRVYDDHPALIEGIRELIRMELVPEAVRSSIYERYSWDHLVRRWVAHVEQEMNSGVAKDSGHGLTPNGDMAGAGSIARLQR